MPFDMTLEIFTPGADEKGRKNLASTGPVTQAGL